MSFMLTTRQMRERTKRVTRRNGWWHLEPGNIVQAVEKGMGLKKGQHPIPICRIRIIATELEPLQELLDHPLYGQNELILEGFPELSVGQFVDMFIKTHKGVTVSTPLNRIAFDFA